MGIKLFSSGSEICTNGKVLQITPDTDTSPNPNPHKFTLMNIYNSEKYMLVTVNYDDAVTYGGNKILIFKREDEDEVLGMIKGKNLDPHFLEDRLSPIARFPASDEGIKIAMDFVNS